MFERGLGVKVGSAGRVAASGGIVTASPPLSVCSGEAQLGVDLRNHEAPNHSSKSWFQA